MPCVSLFFAFLVLGMVLVPPATPAQDKEPLVYLFWSQTCPLLAGGALLPAERTAQRSLAPVRDFEVDQSPSNTLLLSKVYERIGLPEFWLLP